MNLGQVFSPGQVRAGGVAPSDVSRFPSWACHQHKGPPRSKCSVPRNYCAEIPLLEGDFRRERRCARGAGGRPPGPPTGQSLRQAVPSDMDETTLRTRNAHQLHGSHWHRESIRIATIVGRQDLIAAIMLANLEHLYALEQIQTCCRIDDVTGTE